MNIHYIMDAIDRIELAEEELRLAKIQLGDSEVTRIRTVMDRIRSNTYDVRKVSEDEYVISWDSVWEFQGYDTLPALYDIGYHVVRLQQDHQARTIKLFVEKNYN